MGCRVHWLQTDTAVMHHQQTTFSILMITSGPSLWASDSTAGRRQEMKLELRVFSPGSKAWGSHYSD